MSRKGSGYLYLLCFIIRQYYSLQDILIDILLKVVQTAENKARRRQKETYFAKRTDRGRATAFLACAVESAEAFREQVSRIVLSGSLSPTEKLKRLRALVREDDWEPAAKAREALSLLKKDSKNVEHDGNYYEALQEQSLWLQKRATEIVKAVRFNPDTSRAGIVEAITHFVDTQGKIGEHPPLTFLSKTEREMVLDSHKRVRMSLYKALLFQNAGDTVNSGSLNLSHSYRYRSLDEYMISKEDWMKHRAEYLNRAGLEKFADCETVLSDLERKLNTQYRITNENIRTGANRYLVVYGDHQFTITTPKQEETDETRLELFPQSRFVPLCEVLATVQGLTGFLGAFSHFQLAHIHAKPADKLFYASITALGCNITVAKLAQISKDISQSALERTVLTYFSYEALLEANDRILTFAKRLPLSHVFDRPDGLIITASDGQKLGAQGESVMAARSFKFFGKEQGITAYTFRDLHDFLYHSTIFCPTDREAWYTIDGMMHNTVVHSDMHTVDTHGVTPLTFATMHFLGVFFAPRIASLDKRKLSAFLERKHYQEQSCRLLPDEGINREIITEHREDILRFMATILLKETPASQLFERLNSYSHQHPLYKALKEFGPDYRDSVYPPLR